VHSFNEQLAESLMILACTKTIVLAVTHYCTTAV